MAQSALKLADDTKRKPARRVRFTLKELAKIKPPDSGRMYVYDTVQPGLALCITANDSRAYYLYRKVGGRPVKMKLGNFADLSIENARDRVLELGPEIARGVDPSEQKRQARAAMTLGELFDVYLERHAKVHKRRWQEDEAQWKRYLKPWAGRQLDRIKRTDVTALHAKIGKDAPVAANRMLALLSAVYTYAGSIGFKGEHPCKGVKRFKEQARQRYLDSGEVPRFLRALKGESSELAKHAMWLMLLTAQRRETVLAMKWADVDIRRRVWTVQQTKAGRTHEVPLVGLALAILRRRRQSAEDGAVYVLAADNRLGYFSDPIPAVKRVCKRAEIQGRFTPHDIRRTWACWAVAAGVPHNLIQKALDHTPTDITSAVYAHVGIDQLREGFERTTKIMLAQKPQREAK